VTRRLAIPSVSTRRRRLLGALGASALGACAASPPRQALRPVDPAAAPRVGDTWQYAFRSVFRVPAPRTLEVRVLEVRTEDLRDRISAEGEAQTEDHAFASALERVERPVGAERRLIDRIVPRLTVVEFSPYLQAFGALPEEGPIVIALPPFGPPFTGQARRRGSERIAVSAGTFDAVRMEFDVSRTATPSLRPQLDPVSILGTVWYAPAVKRPVRWTVVTRAAGQRNVIVDDTYELASFRVA
jgi:hypothetical protein